jgi:hypothetical protein
VSFVPKTLGQLYDLLSAMSISGPDLRSLMFPEQNIESCFSQVLDGLDQVSNKLGPVGYERLRVAAETAQSLYKSNGYREGVNLLQHMAEYIRLAKYKTDEPVVDESRFEPRPL